jgi:hypothetical protein
LAPSFIFSPFVPWECVCYSEGVKIINDPVSLADLKAMAQDGFGNLVKAVVDVDREIMAVDGELHADEEALLLENGSQQRNLWGINIYPELEGADRIEFDSMINIRPAQGNRSRGVDNMEIREKIIQVVHKLIST